MFDIKDVYPVVISMIIGGVATMASTYFDIIVVTSAVLVTISLLYMMNVCVTLMIADTTSHSCYSYVLCTTWLSLKLSLKVSVISTLIVTLCTSNNLLYLLPIYAFIQFSIFVMGIIMIIGLLMDSEDRLVA